LSFELGHRFQTQGVCNLSAKIPNFWGHRIKRLGFVLQETGDPENSCTSREDLHSTPTPNPKLKIQNPKLKTKHSKLKTQNSKLDRLDIKR